MIRLERTGAVASMVIDRPEAKNAIDLASMAALAGHLETLERDPAVSALVIEAVGPVFISGGDLKELRVMEPAVGRDTALAMHDLLARLEGLPFPTIAAIDADAFGGGWEVSMACDLRVMSKSARVHFRQNALGLTPGWGGGQRLLRAVGYSRALLWLSTAATVSAEEAHRHGLVDALVDSEDDRAASRLAHELAGKIAAVSRPAVEHTKRALLFGRGRPPEPAGRLEAELFARVFGSPDHRERTERLLSKPPARE
ncbi:MAG: enoyl-CoA hydratase/isomerase family protein [Deltaproteobacteria bacterium]|nr:enoyl-CoA hydratase/isomerase family protein [Deltaproteobacteria bacterium]